MVIILYIKQLAPYTYLTLGRIDRDNCSDANNSPKMKQSFLRAPNEVIVVRFSTAIKKGLRHIVTDALPCRNCDTQCTNRVATLVQCCTITVTFQFWF